MASISVPLAFALARSSQSINEVIHTVLLYDLFTFGSYYYVDWHLRNFIHIPFSLRIGEQMSKSSNTFLVSSSENVSIGSSYLSRE